MRAHIRQADALVQQQGRKRQALLIGRPCAGDQALPQRLGANKDRLVIIDVLVQRGFDFRHQCIQQTIRVGQRFMRQYTTLDGKHNPVQGSCAAQNVACLPGGGAHGSNIARQWASPASSMPASWLSTWQPEALSMSG